MAIIDENCYFVINFVSYMLYDFCVINSLKVKIVEDIKMGLFSSKLCACMFAPKRPILS